MNYSPKFNHIFIKLINKICNQIKKEYVDEYIEKCNNFINICNLRNTWTKHFN